MMKFQLFTLLLVVAAVSAKPSFSDVSIVEENSEGQQRIIVEGQIRRIIQQVRDGIKNAGLDPLEVERVVYEDAPVPFLVEIKAFIENLKFNGLSNIVIHNLDYSLIFNRLRMDLSIPAIRLSIGDSGIQASVFGNSLEGQLNGSLGIISLRLATEVRVNIGIISGISIRSISINFSLGGIESNLFISALGNDYSDDANVFLGESIPKFVSDNSASINKYLEDLIKDLLDSL
ncbi:uncharacterized protein LOC116766428 [Danaus plexippus]|uniref:Uncharacterized protein n=1 Tax=Danaus plexippus plexippus TaxID=278856 RepID=A0A212FJE1_DANPL|nr:uncharacterized protein LOC116766428 [Danaus plexippus]OWR53829.1 hypothetical protein KGM_202181 [Danaus plexippus plexippus]